MTVPPGTRRRPRHRSRVLAVLVAAALLAAGCQQPRPSLGLSTPAPTVTPEATPAIRPPVLLREVPYGGPHPTLEQLLRGTQYGEPPFLVDPGAGPADWRLAHPGEAVVAGYAGRVSVRPGKSLDLHISSSGGPVRLDVFRIGRDDAEHLLTARDVPASPQRQAAPARPSGLVTEHWPASYRLAIPTFWRSGVYLVKLTAASGDQSYLDFVVRPTTPQPLLVVVSMLTYAAYNDYGGSDLYRWPGGPRPEAVVSSFDRPFNRAFGAGLLFASDFPLIVWLEDHGYSPAYATDIDVSNDPSLVTHARAVLVSGHAEYWTTSQRDAFDAARAAGVSLLNMGANEASWQVRMRPEDNVADRIEVCWKDIPDPIATVNPQLVTKRFAELPSPRPSSQLFGEDYAGIVSTISPMTLGPGIATFAPDSGLKPGESVPGLVADEVDYVTSLPGALVLSATHVATHASPDAVAGTTALVVGGAHLFDAGTLAWSWGLDPRYAAALPSFPADSWGRLMEDLLEWAGIAEPG